MFNQRTLRVQYGRRTIVAAALRGLSGTALAAVLALGVSVGAPTQAQAQAKLTVAKVAADMALIMGDFGKSKGIFQKHGLDVDFPLIDQPKMVQALLAGSIDMAMSSGNTLVFAAKGAPIKGVAALDGPPKMLGLVVATDSKVKTPDDLKGKTVAITSKGSLTDWAVAQLAVAKGWPDAAIVRAAIGNTPARVAALRAGVADAAVIDIASGLDLEGRGEGKMLMNFGDVIKNFQNQLVVASDATIKNKPELVRKYLAGLFETLAYARAHKAEMVAFTQQELKVSEAVASKVYDQLVGDPNFFSKDGRFDRATLKAMGDTFLAQKQIPQAVDLTKTIDESFLPGAK